MIGVRLLTDYTNHPAYDSPSVVNVDAESRFADFDGEAKARWRFIRRVGVNIVIASEQRPFEII